MDLFLDTIPLTGQVHYSVWNGDDVELDDARQSLVTTAPVQEAFLPIVDSPRLFVFSYSNRTPELRLQCVDSGSFTRHVELEPLLVSATRTHIVQRLCDSHSGIHALGNGFIQFPHKAQTSAWASEWHQSLSAHLIKLDIHYTPSLLTVHPIPTNLTFTRLANLTTAPVTLIPFQTAAYHLCSYIPNQPLVKAFNTAFSGLAVGEWKPQYSILWIPTQPNQGIATIYPTDLCLSPTTPHLPSLPAEAIAHILPASLQPSPSVHVSGFQAPPARKRKRAAPFPVLARQVGAYVDAVARERERERERIKRERERAAQPSLPAQHYPSPPQTTPTAVPAPTPDISADIILPEPVPEIERDDSPDPPWLRDDMGMDLDIDMSFSVSAPVASSMPAAVASSSTSTAWPRSSFDADLDLDFTDDDFSFFDNPLPTSVSLPTGFQTSFALPGSSPMGIEWSPPDLVAIAGMTLPPSPGPTPLPNGHPSSVAGTPYPVHNLNPYGLAFSSSLDVETNTFAPIPFSPVHRARDDKYSQGGKFAYSVLASSSGLPSPPATTVSSSEEDSDEDPEIPKDDTWKSRYETLTNPRFGIIKLLKRSYSQPKPRLQHKRRKKKPRPRHSSPSSSSEEEDFAIDLELDLDLPTNPPPTPNVSSQTFPGPNLIHTRFCPIALQRMYPNTVIHLPCPLVEAPVPTDVPLGVPTPTSPAVAPSPSPSVSAQSAEDMESHIQFMAQQTAENPLFPLLPPSTKVVLPDLTTQLGLLFPKQQYAKVKTLSAPHITLMRPPNSHISVSSPALQFWDKLGLAPRGGGKVIWVAAIIIMSPDEDAAEADLGINIPKLVEVWDSKHLGRLNLCMTLPQGNAVHWLHTHLYTTETFGNLHCATEQIGIISMVSPLTAGVQGDPDKASLVFIRLPSVTSPSHQRETFRSISRTVRGALATRPDIIPHFLPPDGVIDLANLAECVYNRLWRNVMRLTPAGFDLTPLETSRQGAGYWRQDPMWTLAPATPTGTHVKFNSRNPGSDVVLDPTITHRLLHAAYAFVDGWAVAACMDETAAAWDVATWFCPPVDIELDKIDVQKAISDVGQFIHRFMKKASIHWDPVITKLGPMSEAELREWASYEFTVLTTSQASPIPFARRPLKAEPVSSASLHPSLPAKPLTSTSSISTAGPLIVHSSPNAELLLPSACGGGLASGWRHGSQGCVPIASAAMISSCKNQVTPDWLWLHLHSTPSSSLTSAAPSPYSELDVNLPSARVVEEGGEIDKQLERIATSFYAFEFVTRSRFLGTFGGHNDAYILPWHLEAVKRVCRVIDAELELDVRLEELF